MPPRNRGKRSFLNTLFRRNRQSRPTWPGERSSSSRSKRSGERFSLSKLKRSTQENIHETLNGFKSLFKRAGTGQLGSGRQGEVDASSIGGLWRSLRMGVNAQLNDRDVKKKNSTTTRLSQIFWRNGRRLLLGTPSLVVAIFCLSMILSYTPNRLVRQLGYTNRFDRALADQDFRQADLLVRNQISSMSRPQDQDLFRYALLMAAQNKILQTRELLELLTETSDRSYGPAHLELARALSVIPNPNDEANLKIERHLLRAMVHAESEVPARIALGRFYRLRGRFNDAERILEPVRTNEDGCIELGLVRNSQKRYDDIPTTLAPYVSRWRDQWKKPANIGQFEHAAIGLILLRDEKTVIDGLDQPKIAIAPSRIDDLRELGLGLWLERLLREGESQYSTILQVIQNYHSRLPCSTVWIQPLMTLTEPSSPVRDAALSLRGQITLASSCEPAFLHEFAVRARLRGEFPFVRDLYQKILDTYPDEIMSINNLAMLYLDSEPKDPQKALELIEPIIQKRPDFLEVYDTRAQIKLAMGNVQAAIEDYLKALPVYCLKPEYHTRLAHAYRLAKDEPNALIHEELARELSGASN